ncbi:hypothetical protein [Streptomyces venezuelae]|uniref:hypothetical protein n=1 Tax=Streptomyces venezuelae TaxID=54571 RepID=UPI003425BF3A
MPRNTFPSGAIVELPAGMPVCQAPDSVTYDCSRVIPVGTTAAGNKVISSFSCAAYARAAWVLGKHRDIAERENGLHLAQTSGRHTAKLREHLAFHHRILARTLTTYVTDPAPCTCTSTSTSTSTS